MPMATTLEELRSIFGRDFVRMSAFQSKSEKRIVLVAGVFAVAGLAGCGSGSTVFTSPPARASAPPGTTLKTGTARITVTFPLASPAAAHGVHTLSYVSGKTRSVGLNVVTVNGATPNPAIRSVANVGAGAANCAVAGTTLTCTFAIAVPAGNDAFGVQTFAQADGVGTPISVGIATATVISGATIDIPIVFKPVISFLTFSTAPSSAAIDKPATFVLTPVGRDSAGDAIGGTDPYDQPFVVTSKDASGHVVATPTLPATLTVPGQTITFAYDGKGAAASYVYSVSVKSDGLFAPGLAPTDAAIAFTGNGQHLYVASQFDNAIRVYDIASDGSLTGPSRTLQGSTTTLARPTAVAVDALGAVYVVNYHRDVTVYPAGANGDVAPTFTFAKGINPINVTVSAGAQYAIVGSTNPSDDSTTNVYLGTLYSAALPPGSATPAPNIPFPIPFMNSFAASPLPDMNSASLLNCAGTDDHVGDTSVICYNSPLFGSASFRIPASPNDLKFRADGKLAVSNGRVFGRDPGIATYSGSPISGTLFTPTYEITGSQTGLVSPTAIAFDAFNNMYVGDTGNASGAGNVRVWPMNASGNVAPTRTVTGLNYPFGIAIGK